MLRHTSQILITVLFTFILSACSSDYSEELSGDYFYVDEGPTAKEIVCHDSHYKGVYGEVVAYDYNSDFIIALQRPFFGAFESQVAFDQRDDTVKYPNKYNPGTSDKSIIDADSILKTDPYYIKIFAHEFNYWIIVTKKNQLYGPLTHEEYLQTRTVLKVPDALALKEH